MWLLLPGQWPRSDLRGRDAATSRLTHYENDLQGRSTKNVHTVIVPNFRMYVKSVY